MLPIILNNLPLLFQKALNAEIERRKLGRDLQKLKDKQAKMEMKELKDQMKKDKEEQKKAKEKIRQQIEQDRYGHIDITGQSHPYHLDESIFILRGFRSNFTLLHFSMKFYVSKQNSPRW